MSRIPAAAILVLLAGAAVALPVDETEPDGFTTPPPQPIGVLGAGGLSVSGVLDPTSPTGLDPGDDDGFSFTMEAAGPLSATVDDGAGGTFVLALAEETVDGPVLRATVLGPAPLTLTRPALAAGPVFRIGVGALGDGTPRAYVLDLSPVNGLPPWTGQPCGGLLPESEPNEDAVTATDLGWFDRVLCGSGEIAVVSPIESGIDGDDDTFRFRNVLPVAATVKITADPGTVDVEVSQLGFIGPLAVASATFGSETTLGLPLLEPGGDYMIRLSARLGQVPLQYRFYVEPVGPGARPPPEPMNLDRTVLRLGPDARRSRFSFRGSFEEGLGETLMEDADLLLQVRGGETALASGKLAFDALGRLSWKAPKGLDGIRSFVYDSTVGTVVVKGRGVDLAGDVDPADPSVFVELDFGSFRIAATEQGVFSRKGRVLKVK